MLVHLLCSFGLLWPSLTQVPATPSAGAPCVVLQAKNVSSRRIPGDAPSSVRYVVQKTQPTSGEAIQPKLVAEYYGAKALGPEGVWKLKNGITVAGQAYETADERLL